MPETTNTALEFTEQQILDSGDYEAPLYAGGVRCHGGFDATGAYRSPRTAHRVPAIHAWQERLRSQGHALVEVDPTLLPPQYPNVEQAKLLLSEGVQRARQRFFSKSAAQSSVFLTSQEAPLQLVGASEGSIEGAVHDALEQACRAVPRLHWVEVSKIRGEVVDGRVQEWQVELKAWLDPEP